MDFFVLKLQKRVELVKLLWEMIKPHLFNYYILSMSGWHNLIQFYYKSIKTIFYYFLKFFLIIIYKMKVVYIKYALCNWRVKNLV